MKEKSYLTSGFMAILLLGVLLLGGCVAHVSRLETRPIGEGPVGAHLPTTDVTSGTEPITRYPGSVMLSHLEMNLEEVSGFQINYASTDDVDTVANWYTTEFGSEGWDKEAEIISEGTTIVIYRKDSRTAQLTIAPEEFTLISVIYSVEV